MTETKATSRAARFDDLGIHSQTGTVNVLGPSSKVSMGTENVPLLGVQFWTPTNTWRLEEGPEPCQRSGDAASLPLAIRVRVRDAGGAMDAARSPCPTCRTDLSGEHHLRTHCRRCARE